MTRFAVGTATHPTHAFRYGFCTIREVAPADWHAFWTEVLICALLQRCRYLSDAPLSWMDGEDV